MPAVRYAYASSGPVRRLVRRAVSLRPFAWACARWLPAVDRTAFRLTRGHVTPSALLTGLPVVQLVTVGAASGEERTARVLGIPVEDGHVAVAANFGAARHPAWYRNLVAHPEARVDGVACVARELHGREREEAFELAASVNPGVRRFPAFAGGRPIPVLHLRRLG